MYPETAQPTRRLITAGTWLFAIVVAYPYLPGSETEAFKGVSVFVGLMFTLGSAGIVQHVMSGFMITYSRALRVGDFVKIGDVEGTVTHARHPVDQGQDAAARGDHHPERRRHGADDHRLLAVRARRGRDDADLGDDRLRHSLAADRGAAAGRRRAHAPASGASRGRS